MVAAVVVGLSISITAGAEQANFLTLDFQYDGGDARTAESHQAVSSSAAGATIGDEHYPLAAAAVTFLTGVPIAVSVHRGEEKGGIQWRDRGDGADDPLVKLAEDCVFIAEGSQLALRLKGMPPGDYTADSSSKFFRASVRRLASWK